MVLQLILRKKTKFSSSEEVGRPAKTNEDGSVTQAKMVAVKKRDPNSSMVLTPNTAHSNVRALNDGKVAFTQKCERRSIISFDGQFNFKPNTARSNVF
jgi:hypothetical protein